ncbi:hypothetical protein TNCV_1112211 [Trichonephila clavipes]|uniref:Uncharacterized protein n=1 Tax=Trichonephila clavipes TaxID=2585209 RepID=A0A8X6V3Z0_TRICX|nr:hypothetical protein TNCV_1112211 [Trichonephila clavipes]
MSKSKELSEFDRGSIVGCHLCGKSVREIADILQKSKTTPLTSQTSLHRMRSIDCNGVELTIIGLWTSGKRFFGVMNLALQSGSRMDASGFGGCPANIPLVTALCPLLSLVVEA